MGLRAHLTSLADQYLVPEWRKAHHFISLQAAALQGAILVAWAEMPDDLKAALPSWLLPAIAGFVLFVGAAGVMYNQKKLLKDSANGTPK